MLLIMSLPFMSRRAFEQAGRAPGHVFSRKADIDIEKVKQSKYFHALLQQYNLRPTNRMVGNETHWLS